MRVLFVVALALALQAHPGEVDGQARIRPEIFAAIDSSLQLLTAPADGPSVAVAVMHGGVTVWAAGFGYSDAARSVRTTARTPFAVGSVAKAVTATALMRLSERKLVELDRPLSAYLPGEVRVDAGDSLKLTPAALASMTGGMPHLWRHYWQEDAGTAPGSAALVREFAAAVFPPGEFYHYSNLSFGVLERLIEKVSGRAFSEVVAAEVFKPLGMFDSFFASATNKRNYAIRRNANGSALPDYVFTEPEGGAALVASAHDLARFGAFHAGAAPAILNSASLTRMHTPVRAEWFYGLGMGTDGKSLVMDGAVPGGAGIIKVFPAEQLVVVVVTNVVSNNTPTYAYVDRIANAALGALGKTPAPGGIPPFFESRPLTADPARAGQWRGQIRQGGDATPIGLEFAGDSVLVSVGSGAAARATSASFGSGHMTIAFAGVLPGLPRTSDVSLSARLLLIGDTMTGYVFAATSSNRGSFGLPFSVQVARVR